MKRLIVILLAMAAVPSISRAGSPEEGEQAQPFDRGIGKSTTVFVPKGTFATGVSFSYNTIDIGQGAGDSGYSMLFNLLNGIKGTMYSFGIAPQISYCVADNLSVGARFDYDRSSLGLGSASLSLNDDLGFGVSDYNILQHKFGGSLTLRYYMSIADSRRFGIFTEVRATGAYGQAKTWKVDGDDKYGTYQISYDGALTFVPGVSVFIQENVALEVAMGILGINYSYTEQIRNQVEHSTMQTSGANFRINPLTIEIGTCIYFYGSKNKGKK